MQDGDTKRLVVQATKDVLENAPSYDRTNRRYADQMNGTSTEQTGSTTQPAPANNSNATGNTSGAGSLVSERPRSFSSRRGRP